MFMPMGDYVPYSDERDYYSPPSRSAPPCPGCGRCPSCGHGGYDPNHYWDPMALPPYRPWPTYPDLYSEWAIGSPVTIKGTFIEVECSDNDTTEGKKETN